MEWILILIFTLFQLVVYGFLILALRYLMFKKGINQDDIQSLLKGAVIVLSLAGIHALIGLLLAVPTDWGRIYFVFASVFSFFLFAFFALGLGLLQFILEDAYDPKLYEKLLLKKESDYSFFDFLNPKKQAPLIGIVLLLFLASIAVANLMGEQEMEPSYPAASPKVETPIPPVSQPDLVETSAPFEDSIAVVDQSTELKDFPMRRLLKLKAALDFEMVEQHLDSLSRVDLPREISKQIGEEQKINRKNKQNLREKRGELNILFPYKVKAGETVSAIAQKFQVGLSSINTLENNQNILKAGDFVYVPHTATLRRHEIVQGETLFTIARDYRLWVNQLFSLNKLKRGEDKYLRIGDSILVFDGLEKER